MSHCKTSFSGSTLLTPLAVVTTGVSSLGKNTVSGSFVSRRRIGHSSNRCKKNEWPCSVPCSMDVSWNSYCRYNIRKCFRQRFRKCLVLSYAMLFNHCRNFETSQSVTLSIGTIHVAINVKFVECVRRAIDNSKILTLYTGVDSIYGSTLSYFYSSCVLRSSKASACDPLLVN